MKIKKEQAAVVFTIGHSTRAIRDFIEILKSYEINKVVDIRTIPKSRHNPQFSEDALRESLKAARIAYMHMKGLGGLRHSIKDSLNTGWRNASFRGFADYMQSDEFEQNIEKLMTTAAKNITVIMCAESLPWRCHRALIGDALLIRGITVRHIMNAHASMEHELTPWAKVKGTKIIYPL